MIVASSLIATYRPFESSAISNSNMHSLNKLRMLFFPALFLCSNLATADEQMGDWQHMKAIRPEGYICLFSKGPIELDGKLEDAAWQSAPWTNDFVDIEGDAKPKPRQSTRAKMLWDAQNLYIAAELMETHLQGTLTEHDAVIFQDNDFEVFVDPDGDNHQYVEFEMNALNTTWDLLLNRPYKDGGKADNGWEFDGLKSAVHLDGTLNDPSDQDKGWTLEIAIPWTAFRKSPVNAYPPKQGDRWRIDFSRVEWQFDVVDGKYLKKPKTKEDNWVWSPQGIIDMHRPERWGFVQFEKAETAPANYVEEASLVARDTLMEVYHRQKSFHGQNKKWAVTPEELGISAESLPTIKHVRIDANETGYNASYSVEPVGKNSTPVWNVSQDSRLWPTWRTLSDLEDFSPKVELALSKSGENRQQLELALEQCPVEQFESIQFLVANMPDRDLTSLNANFLLENTQLAWEAWKTSPWKDQITKEIYLNEILPYANINESRDDWRRDFRERFLPLIAEAKTISQAAAMINQKLFALVNVRYSTKRAKADQSPLESMRSGLASCTGLSILMIDACRACGIPARFVGIPLWPDKSGNHSWVEVWDNGWHFTGACEANGDDLDKAWFTDRASTAIRDNPLHSIYAVSFQKTPMAFPLVWNRSIDYIRAVNVTDRYTQLKVTRPEGTTKTMFRVLDSKSKERVTAKLSIADSSGKVVSEGNSNDERFDSNDHLSFYLPEGQSFTVTASLGDQRTTKDFKAENRDKPIELVLVSTQGSNATPERILESPTSSIDALKKFLASASDSRQPINQMAEFKKPLSRAEAEEAARLLYEDRISDLKKTRAQEMEQKELVIDNLKMPFAYKIFGDKPASGRSLYISMHGGGGAPPRVNTQQWENQKKLYQVEEGVYLAPRAPTDTWDLWHQSHIDRFLDRLVENLIVFEDVNPNRVFLMGYSAGGDGVYQLAPRLADRFAAASMMAGHPNETSPLGLRNLPFTLHMGEKDSAYNRNKIAAEWKDKLAELRTSDPNGYEHYVKIHEGKGHWMEKQDAEALPWMAKFERNTTPTKIVWKQDDVKVSRFYWLAVDPTEVRDRALIVANREGQTIDLQSTEADRIRILLNDTLIDFDKPVKVTSGGKTLFEGRIERTIAAISKSLQERFDGKFVYSAEILVSVR
jgi:hypothetical protein